ncbi:hypothetical protein K2Z83_07860 [Oscillochloris sp. ZM17-4]|uniref:hypothetical protein n=1 Tax=Oscillochloris sp. ZM17-4 TaxID=2866714 RepID=UPI001C73B370|nr:hypothetical protein [Oscillochloris sp. ZM17-4]MBX0327590.1 hypothetical protein [Oscillochloris sp. ZM17-4]
MSFLRDLKRLVAVLIAGASGLIVLLDFAGSGPIVAMIARALVGWAALITAIALLIGILSVSWSHVQRMRRRSADWGYSIVLLAGMLLVIVIGVFFPLPGTSGVVLPRSLAEQPIRQLFSTVYEPIASSLLALLAFFSLSAALRALGRRSADAVVIVVVAAVVLVAQLPLVYTLPGVAVTVQWVNDYVALAGARGLLIGAAIGAIVASVRVLLGFDLPYLDR